VFLTIISINGEYNSLKLPGRSKKKKKLRNMVETNKLERNNERNNLLRKRAAKYVEQ